MGGVLYLNEAEITTLKHMLPVFTIVLASLTAVEICRFLLLAQLRETLLRFDSANERILSSNTVTSSKSKRSTKKSEAAGSTPSGLTERLLDDEEVGAVGETARD